MISKIFQDVLDQTRDILNRPVGVIDDQGDIIAYTGKIIPMEIIDETINSFSVSTKMYQNNGYTFLSISNKAKLDYIIYAQGTDKDTENNCQMLAISLSTIKGFYDEKYDKASFMKNVIMENIFAGDMLFKAKELQIDTKVPRAVFLIRCEKPADFAEFALLQNIFPEKEKEFIINIDEADIVLIKELDKDNATSEHLVQIAKEIQETLSSELVIKTTIGLGSVADDIKDISKSFKEAQISIEVGKVFDTESSILDYHSLGIARLIHQLPPKLCELFLEEVFKKDTIEVLDEETIHTIQKFFEYNLNVSETARQLYVHRNTLVYRLDKILRLTGLDLREFDQAIVFKIAMMVNKYLSSQKM